MAMYGSTFWPTDHSGVTNYRETRTRKSPNTQVSFLLPSFIKNGEVAKIASIYHDSNILHCTIRPSRSKMLAYSEKEGSEGSTSIAKLWHSCHQQSTQRDYWQITFEKNIPVLLGHNSACEIALPTLPSACMRVYSLFKRKLKC